MTGQTVSHYRILEKIGSGGMGEVYLAEDSRLKRQVALKFLPQQMTADPEAKERFEREAQAAAALNHPNIVTVHEIGEHQGQVFIAMEYVEGRTLKELISGSVGANNYSPLPIAPSPLPLAQVLEIAIQLASGLAAAHAKGIVHRDVKPQNIVIDRDGHVKILDFGLAKLKGVSTLTKEASTLGTVHYMSPEQTMGKEVDHRTDIWSLGVVLYEMISGQLPFKGDYEQAVIYAIINEKSEPMTELRSGLPVELDRILAKALAKDRDERYPHLADLIVGLRRLKNDSRPEAAVVTAKKKTKPRFLYPALAIALAAFAFVGFLWLKNRRPATPAIDPAVTSNKPSIAVLPFANMSADPENEYFSDGLAEEVINALSKLEGIHVTARTSAFCFRGKNFDIREISKQLNVGNVLEGSVRKAGNRLRITVQLINAANGYHLWSERYDRELKDVFSVQDDISLAIVNSLKVKLLGKERERLAKRYTNNLEAYDLYLKGRYYLNRFTKANIDKSLDYFQQAIQKDPEYALAYGGVAGVYFARAMTGQSPSRETMPKAKLKLLQALKLDDSISELHAWLGDLYLSYEWDWSAAERELKQAITLKPNSPEAHQFYSDYLSVMGHLDEAMAEAERALALDPLSVIAKTIFIYQLIVSRQFDRAIEHCREALKTEPSFLIQSHLWRALYLNHRLEEAWVECKKLFTLFISREIAEAMEISYAESGYKGAMRTAARKMAGQSETIYIPTTMIASLFAHAEDNDQALQWLERAYEERDMYFYSVGMDPDWDGMRSHPRFTALLKKAGLEK